MRKLYDSFIENTHNLQREICQGLGDLVTLNKKEESVFYEQLIDVHKGMIDQQYNFKINEKMLVVLPGNQILDGLLDNEEGKEDPKPIQSGDSIFPYN